MNGLKTTNWQNGNADGVVIRTFAARLSPGAQIPPHQHDWDQLVYASTGVMTVFSQVEVWVVPPHRALWVPAGIRHWIEMSGRLTMNSLYFIPGHLATFPGQCSVVNITPLVRELIVHIVDHGVLKASIPEHLRLAAVLMDLLATLPHAPLTLPMPQDSRAKTVVDRLKTVTDSQDSLEFLARTAGASKRTLERVWLKETGMTFGRWRQQFRLLNAMRLLAEGEKVTAVAFRVGYESPSAFVAMFKKALGTTPRKYMGNTQT